MKTITVLIVCCAPETISHFVLADSGDTKISLSYLFVPYIHVVGLLGLQDVIADSLESAYSLNWGVHEIWGQGGRENLALLL